MEFVCLFDELIDLLISYSPHVTGWEGSVYVICWIEFVWATDSHLNLYKHVRSVLLSVMLLTLKIVETPFKDFVLFSPCSVV